MKKIKWLTILFFLFTACQKNVSNNSSNSRQNNKTIVGQWEWFYTTFPYATSRNTPYFWIMKFNSDSTCTSTGNYLPSGAGVYSLKDDNAGLPAPLLPPFVEPHKFYCSLYQMNLYDLNSPDTLLLTHYPSLDGPIFYFVRK